MTCWEGVTKIWRKIGLDLGTMERVTSLKCSDGAFVTPFALRTVTAIPNRPDLSALD